jgi:dipeptidyl aminopeptidase/acylaminoacyl peptidase
VLELVRYPSKVGALSAYVTPRPKTPGRVPAVVWAHGGWGGIDETFWTAAAPEDDQSAAAFRAAGIALMVPSTRGENDNPGQYEAFYGEVDDLLAARDYLAQLPWVDPARIYLAGHSTGGTLTLLAAESSEAFRAAFSLGPVAQIAQYGFTDPPYDGNEEQQKRERALRSPVHYLRALRRPTFVFEGTDPPTNRPSVLTLVDAAGPATLLRVHFVPRTTHFSVLAPITALVARKIVADTGPTCAISFTADEIAGVVP